MLIEVQTAEEFIDAHGGRPIRLGKSGQWLLPDGSAISTDGHMRQLPPAKELERLKAIARYHQLAHEQADRAFMAYKSHVVELANNAARSQSAVGPPADALDQLRRLDEVRSKAFRAWSDADEAVENLPEVQEARKHHKYQEEWRQRMKLLAFTLSNYSGGSVAPEERP